MSTQHDDARNRRVMTAAEAQWLKPDEPTPKCLAASCLGPHCKRRSDCPEPDKLADYEWDRAK